MAPRSVTRSAHPPDIMDQGRLENEECPLLPDEDQDQCSDDHGHGTTQKVKTFRDPSVRLTPSFPFLFLLVRHCSVGSIAGVFSAGITKIQRLRRGISFR